MVLMARNSNTIPDPSLSSKLFMLDDETPACSIAMDLLSKLCEGMEQILTMNPTATTEHHLHEFGKDPSQCIHSEIEDWEDLLCVVLMCLKRRFRLEIMLYSVKCRDASPAG